jgi:hypothetical protein
MTQFSKPSRKPRNEPAGLDAFAAGVPATVVHLVASPATEPAPEPAAEPEAEREIHGMNVRFTATEKAALVKLAEHEQRSQHQILKRLLGPVLLEAARAIE